MCRFKTKLLVTENPFGLEFSTQTETNLSHNKGIYDENTQFRNEVSKHPQIDRAKTNEKYRNIAAEPKIKGATASHCKAELWDPVRLGSKMFQSSLSQKWCQLSYSPSLGNSLGADTSEAHKPDPNFSSQGLRHIWANRFYFPSVSSNMVAVYEIFDKFSNKIYETVIIQQIL